MQDPTGFGSDPVEEEKFKPELGKLMIRDLYQGEDTTPEMSDLRFIDSVDEINGFTSWHYQEIAEQRSGYDNPEIHFSSGVDTATDGQVVQFSAATRVEHRYATEEDLTNWVQKLASKYDDKRMQSWVEEISYMTGIDKTDLSRLQGKIKK